MNLAYTIPADELSPTFAVGPSTTAIEDYEAANLENQSPHDPAMLTELDGTIVADMGAQVVVGAVLLSHYSYDEDLAVHIRANNDNVWTGTQPLDESITIPAYHGDRFSRSVWWDLETRIPLEANRTFRYWQITPASANSRTIAIGLLKFFSRVRRVDENISWGISGSLAHGSIRNRTKFGIDTVYEFGTRERGASAQFEEVNQATLNQALYWRQNARGGARPFFVCYTGEENLVDPLAEPMYVDWADDSLDATFVYLTTHTFGVLFHELGFGKPHDVVPEPTS